MTMTAPAAIRRCFSPFERVETTWRPRSPGKTWKTRFGVVHQHHAGQRAGLQSHPPGQLRLPAAQMVRQGRAVRVVDAGG